MTAGGSEVAICVIGAGRSGTSLTTRILDLLGLYIGTDADLRSPARKNRAAGNPNGFWEHAGVTRLNRQILKRMGGSGLKPPRLSPGWERSAELEGERERARSILDETLRGRGPWGWKDPRASLTLPFWRQSMPGLRAVICVRNPLEMAASLFDFGRSAPRSPGGRAVLRPIQPGAFGLWLTYTASALLNTARTPRLIVPYEDYFDDWRAAAARLVRFAGLDPAVLEGEAGERIEATIDSRARHHHASLDELLGDERVPVDIASLYLTVRILAALPSERAAVLSAGVDVHAARLLEDRANCRAAAQASK